jgi:hypothetical protein
MKQYFITIQWYSTKNKLDGMLQEALKGYVNQVIDSDAIPVFKKLHENVSAEYKAKKGRCEAEFKQINPDRYNQNIHITIGTTEIALTEVRGYIRTTPNSSITGLTTNI